MARQSPEESLAEIRELAAELDGDTTNEAKTRLVIVNRVLTEVLGWALPDIDPESGHEAPEGATDWLDYELRAGPARVVVEAKKVGAAFAFSDQRRQPKYKLTTLKKSHGPELRDAITQALRYCGSAGTPFFIVTNGVQWVIGLALWPGVEASELSARVFHDLDEVQLQLDEFIDLASPRAIANHSAVGQLINSIDHAPVFALSLNERLFSNPPAARNYLSAPIATIMREYFGRLVDNVDDEEFVERCYVTSELTDGYVQRLSLYTGNTRPDVLRDASKIDRQKLSRDIAANPRAEFLRSGDLVVIAGGMGSGKSEFVNYATRMIRRSGDGWVVLLVDLIGRTELMSAFQDDRFRFDLARLLLEQAEAEYPDLDPFAHEVLRGVFSADIQRELKSLPESVRSDSDRREEAILGVVKAGKGDPYLHLVRWLSHVSKNPSRPVTVFMDNVDRGSAALEHFVFLFGRGLAEATGVTVVTTMRESTYEAGRREGFLDVGGYTTFTVAPPSFASVASRRFEFAQKSVRENARLRARIQRAMQGYPLERVEDFVSVLFELALGRSRDLGDAIQNLAGPNVRTGLELLTKFATSRNTDIERLLKDYNEGRYQHPRATLVRSLMRGDQLRFAEETSALANIFRVSRTVQESHFSSVRVLQFLAARLDDQDVDAPLGVVMAAVSRVGPSLTSVSRAVSYLGRTGLITSRSHPDHPWPSSATVRITSAGVYYLRELVFESEYIQNIVDETVVYEASVADAIFDAHNDRDEPWHRRYERKVQLFLRYLMDRETAELRRVMEGATGEQWCKPAVPPIAERVLGTEAARDLGKRRGRRSRKRGRGPR